MSAGTGMVIIGAGECGARAALALREKGHDGTIDLIGDEPHLPYERPPLSKAVLADDAASATFITSAGDLAAAGITYRPGVVASAIERAQKTIRLCDGTGVAYDKLLLATGARPRQLMQDGAVVAGVRYLRNMADCLALRERVRPGTRLLVLGAGFLGLEVAATASARGASVSVIESQPRVLLRGVPEAIARVIENRHVQQGVDIRCGVKITRIETAPGAATVELEDGTRLTGDVIVASIGAVPNVELAQAAGLAVDNGILVDASLTTQDGDILAAGDCCAFPVASQNGRVMRLESWRNALDQSAVAAANMLGQSMAYDAVPWFWSDQYELTLQVAGLADPALAVVRRDLGEGAFLLFHLDAAGRLVAASGIGAGGAVARDIRLAQMLIARSACPDPAALARPDAQLKKMVA
ncbi:MAG: ferredoxin reductase [Devosia sp.]|nr:ferredoxin reductase [Devosia sp.]